MKRFAILALACIMYAGAAFAQSIPITTKVGKVSDEEVGMTTYPKDTTADVLILWQDATISIDLVGNGTLVRKNSYIQRAKILKESGKSWGDYSFYIDNDHKELMSHIKVTTYNMENGHVNVVKMPANAIHRKRINDSITELSFSAPEVKVGSVIELSYDIQSDSYWDIGTYYFQRSVPVNYTHLEVRRPEWLNFSKNNKGSLTLQYSQKSMNQTISLGYESESLEFYIENFTGTDIPAMKGESNIYCISQYRSSITYDLQAITLPGSYKNLSSSWEDVDKAILESDIHKVLNSPCRFKPEVDAIMARDLTPIEKVAEIWKLTLGKVSWNKNSALVPGYVSDILKAGSGNSADINAIMGSALKYAGFNVKPVLLRTRDNGMIMDFHPRLNSFNTFVLKVQLDESSSVFLDAACKEGYFNVLTPEYIVKQARIPVADGKGYWEDLTVTDKGHSEFVSAMTKLSADGTLEGSFNMQYRGIPSLMMKMAYNEINDEDKFIDAFENRLGFHVNGMETEQMDSLSAGCSIKMEIQKDCDCAADLIYVPVFLQKFHNRNSFKDAERKYPVDFDYKEMCNYSFYLEIPEGYVVDQMPSPARMSFAPLGATVMFQVTKTGENTLAANFSYRQNVVFLAPEYYPDLKDFWQAMCSLYDSMIVIRKAD